MTPPANQEGQLRRGQGPLELLRRSFDDKYVTIPEIRREQAWERISQTAERRVEELEERRLALENEVATGRRGIMQDLAKATGRKYVRQALALLLTATQVEPGLVRSPETALERPEHRVHFENMEAYDAEFTPERLDWLLREGLPKGWIDNIKSVEFVNEMGSGMWFYGTPDDHFSGSADGLPVIGGDIKIYWNAKEDFATTQDELDLLTHEAAHLNCSVSTYWAVLGRVRAEDRFRSAYVEGITNPVAGVEKLMRATEYWAVIAETYFRTDHPETVLPPADVKIVEAAIRETDPAFDRAKVMRRREELKEEMDADAAERGEGNKQGLSDEAAEPGDAALAPGEQPDASLKYEPPDAADAGSADAAGR